MCLRVTHEQSAISVLYSLQLHLSLIFSVDNSFVHEYGVRFIEKGRVCVATRAFETGDIIFEEKAFVYASELPTRYDHLHEALSPA